MCTLKTTVTATRDWDYNRDVGWKNCKIKYCDSRLANKGMKIEGMGIKNRKNSETCLQWQSFIIALRKSRKQIHLMNFFKNPNNNPI